MTQQINMTDYLDEIQARADATPHGPWTWRQMLACQRVSNPEAILIAEAFEGADSEVTDTPIAAFIAHARTDVPRLVAAIRAVEALHTQTTGYSNGADFDCCGTCFDRDEMPEPWPCPTVTAIRDALEPT